MSKTPWSKTPADYATIREGIITGDSIRSGFPKEFLKSTMAISISTGRSFSIRDGNPPIPGGQYKPMDIKTKTATTDVVPLISARTLPIDKAQLRAGSKFLPDEYYDNPDLQSHNKGSLRFLLGDPNTQILGIDENGRLRYKVKNVVSDEAMSPDAAAGIEYCIELSSRGMETDWTPEQAEMLRNAFDSDLSSVTPNEELLSKWDTESWGELDLDREFHTYMKKEGEEDFTPEMVAGRPPFTGDADMFSISIPVGSLGSIMEEACMIKIPEDIDKLIIMLEEMQAFNLARDTAEKDRRIISEISHTDASDYDKPLDSLSTLQLDMLKTKDLIYQVGDLAEFRTQCKLTGLATNNEFIIAYLINKEASSTLVKDFIKDLVQHGPETNNPGKPSSLDDTILHFYNGELHRTHNEDELIAFYMQPGYLEENFQAIHPKWNMEKWAPVINRQIELGQIRSIKLNVLVNYLKYATENNKPLPKCVNQKIQNDFLAFIKIALYKNKLSKIGKISSLYLKSHKLGRRHSIINRQKSILSTLLKTEGIGVAGHKKRFAEALRMFEKASAANVDTLEEGISSLSSTPPIEEASPTASTPSDPAPVVDDTSIQSTASDEEMEQEIDEETDTFKPGM